MDTNKKDWAAIEWIVRRISHTESTLYKIVKV